MTSALDRLERRLADALTDVGAGMSDGDIDELVSLREARRVAVERERVALELERAEDVRRQGLRGRDRIADALARQASTGHDRR